MLANDRMLHIVQIIFGKTLSFHRVLAALALEFVVQAFAVSLQVASVGEDSLDQVVGCLDQLEEQFLVIPLGQ